MHTLHQPHRRRSLLFAQAPVSSFDDQQLHKKNVVYGQRDDSRNGTKFWRALIFWAHFLRFFRLFFFSHVPQKKNSRKKKKLPQKCSWQKFTPLAKLYIQAHQSEKPKAMRLGAN